MSLWINFPLVAALSAFLWSMAALFRWRSPKLHEKSLHLLTLGGIAVLLFFVVSLWVALGRPPFRTLGETRLWYALFLPCIGYAVYLRWRYKWLLFYSLGMSALFLLINYLHPETYDKQLMPALQSPWFIPHVLVYMFAYALLGASALVAFRGLWQAYSPNSKPAQYKESHLYLADNLVYLGFGFLTLGLLFGALWAKEAWGHYWTWDPKETWAFITWLAYLGYIHLRYHRPSREKMHLGILALSFVFLLLCWFGVNYLAVAENSVHTYTQ